MKLNKWLNGALPALFIHSCIGSVYCWSLLKGDIAESMGTSVSSIELAFSLAIFFLGMSAAFCGRFVEKNVKRSSMLSTLCFSIGLLGSAFAIWISSIWLLFLFYGVIMGIGLGLGYLSPVKTLMLWFSKHKGLATGIAISGFGLSKVIFSPFIEWCTPKFGIEMTLILMSLISIVFMSVSVLFVHKPLDWKETSSDFSISRCIKFITEKTYIKIWIVFYLNITCGLALISFEKNLGLAVGIVNIGLLSSITAAFNTLGRFGYSSVSDYLRDKSWIYIIIFATSLVACILGMWMTAIVVIILLCVINMGYGGGFSTLPTLLQSRFGMGNISTIHGLALSAWAWAGLSGNQLSNLVINYYGRSYSDLLVILGFLYLVSLVIAISIREKKTLD
jgi:OFA family oxalate/formate antiporter-like MFS transporter